MISFQVKKCFLDNINFNFLFNKISIILKIKFLKIDLIVLLIMYNLNIK